MPREIRRKITIIRCKLLKINENLYKIPLSGEVLNKT